MLRVGEQSAFLEEAREKLPATWYDIAEICGVHESTLLNWRCEKSQMSLSALEKLSALSGVPKPKNIIKVSDKYWYTKKAGKAGGRAYLRLYGNPGTLEGRRKGGLLSQKRRRENPELYLKLGVIVRKEVAYPQESDQLAEVFGILLGDGNISDHQVAVYLNSTTDREYIRYVQNLLRTLFETAVSYRERERNTACLVISSKNLVEFLLKKGLVIGDKIAQQVDIPAWIFIKEDFQKACVRGLIDTDGSIYYHTHKVKGNWYRNIGICFTSHSAPLLMSVHGILLDLGFTAKCGNGTHVYLYRQSEVKRYLEEVGTSNPKHLERYNRFIMEKSHK